MKKKPPLMFQVKTFQELTPLECYEIFKLRQDVFIVELNLVFSDITELDQEAHHILYQEEGRLKAYVRVAFEEDDSLLLNRLVVPKSERKTGLAHVFFSRVIEYLRQTYPKRPIHLYAREKLSEFYIGMGFMKCEKKFFEGNPNAFFHFRFNMNWPIEKLE